MGIRTEFLCQMGHRNMNSKIIFIIGITNCLWNLDSSIRKRFTNRVYCGLPDEEARMNLFNAQLKAPHTLSDEDLMTLAQRTEGFTGSDICMIVRDAVMNPIRRIQSAKYFKHINDGNGTFKWIACHSMDDGALKMTLMDIPQNEQSELVIDDVAIDDFLKALTTAQKSIHDDDIQRFAQWKQDFGVDDSV